MGSVLEVFLGDVRVGMLAREAGGRLRFLFSERYAEMMNRPTLSLSYETAPGELMSVVPRAYAGRLPPFFSNLLPEGLLRDLLIRRAGVRRSDEFALLRALGEDLPGGVRVVDPEVASGNTATDHPARHEQRGVLPQRIDGAISTHMESVALDMSGTIASRTRTWRRRG